MKNKHEANSSAEAFAQANRSSRRDAIKSMVDMLGVACASRLISGAGLTVAFGYSRQSYANVGAGKLFDLNAMKTLARVCALVIPATSTPGAAEVDVHGFIDNQLLHCFSTEQQQQVNAVLELVNSFAKEANGVAFIDCSEQQQITLLNALDLGEMPFDSSAKSSFRFLKSLIAFGYFTSEVGATKTLRYQAIPGGFKGSIPYRQGDASWAPTFWI